MNIRKKPLSQEEISKIIAGEGPDCWIKKWDSVTQQWYWYNWCEGWSIPPPITQKYFF